MVTNLDLLDKKILTELDLNCRQPTSALAKKIGTSRNVIEYRISRLQEKGIIKGFITLTDPGKLGFMVWNVYMEFQNLTPLIEKKLINNLIKNKRVWWIAQTTGNWNLIYSIYVKDIKEFYNTVETFNSIYGNYILNQSMVAHVQVEVFSRGYFINKPSIGKTWYEKFDTIPIDDTDKKILSILIKDARRSSIEIARELSTTPRVVTYRIKELVRKGIISRFKVLFDQTKMGMGYYKVLIHLKNLSKKQDESLKEYCRILGRVFYYENKVGPWMLELEMEVESYKETHELMKKMKERFPDYIKSYSIHLIYNELKGEYDLMQQYSD